MHTSRLTGRHTSRYSRRHTGTLRGRNTRTHTARHMSKNTIRHSCNILYIYVLSETLPDIEADIPMNIFADQLAKKLPDILVDLLAQKLEAY